MHGHRVALPAQGLAGGLRSAVGHHRRTAALVASGFPSEPLSCLDRPNPAASALHFAVHEQRCADSAHGRPTAAEENPAGTAQSITATVTSRPSSSTPLCATARSTRVQAPSTAKLRISSGHRAPPSAERPNWRPCPMTVLRDSPADPTPRRDTPGQCRAPVEVPGPVDKPAPARDSFVNWRRP